MDDYQLYQMVIDAYEACRAEAMSCPWCGLSYLSYNTEEEHHPDCDWLKVKRLSNYGDENTV